MTNLNDHIKQQQEVNRGKAKDIGIACGCYDIECKNTTLSPDNLDTLTADTIKKALAEVTHEWNKAEQKLDGTAQGAVNCIEHFRNYLTQLEDSNK